MDFLARSRSTSRVPSSLSRQMRAAGLSRFMVTDDQLYEREAAKGLEEGEERFGNSAEMEVKEEVEVLTYIRTRVLLQVVQL